MNNTLVVRLDSEVGVRVSLVDCKKQPNLDRDDLRPTDIAAVGIPTLRKFPGIPYTVEDDADAPRG
jgi:hypothetical protein